MKYMLIMRATEETYAAFQDVGFLSEAIERELLERKRDALDGNR